MQGFMVTSTAWFTEQMWNWLICLPQNSPITYHSVTIRESPCPRFSCFVQIQDFTFDPQRNEVVGKQKAQLTVLNNEWFIGQTTSPTKLIVKNSVTVHNDKTKAQALFLPLAQVAYLPLDSPLRSWDTISGNVVFISQVHRKREVLTLGSPLQREEDFHRSLASPWAWIAPEAHLDNQC